MRITSSYISTIFLFVFFLFSASACAQSPRWKTIGKSPLLRKMIEGGFSNYEVKIYLDPTLENNWEDCDFRLKARLSNPNDEHEHVLLLYPTAIDGEDFRKTYLNFDPDMGPTRKMKSISFPIFSTLKTSPGNLQSLDILGAQKITDKLAEVLGINYSNEFYEALKNLFFDVAKYSTSGSPSLPVVRASTHEGFTFHIIKDSKYLFALAAVENNSDDFWWRIRQMDLQSTCNFKLVVPPVQDNVQADVTGSNNNGGTQINNQKSDLSPSNY